MTKLAFCADVHLGNHKRHGGKVTAGLNVRCQQAFVVLERAVEIAIDQDCQAFIVVGDLFDSSKPEPQVIAEAQRILSKLGRSGCDCVLIAGNHDKVSNTHRDNAIGAMAPAVARIVDEPWLGTWGRIEVQCLPHVAGADAATWLKAGVEQFVNPLAGVNVRLLAAHVGITDEHSPKYLRGPGAADVQWMFKFLADNGLDIGFFGDYHQGQDWTAAGPIKYEVHQCGALVPTGWNDSGCEQGHYGSLLVFDDSGLSRAPSTGCTTTRFELDGPRFYASTSLAKPPATSGAISYVRLTVPPSDVADAKLRLKMFGPFVGEVLIDDSEAHEALQVASASARSQTTLDAALDAYVSAMALAATVKRDEVLSRCRDYLKK